jgi:hypothetical protein
MGWQRAKTQAGGSTMSGSEIDFNRNEVFSKETALEIGEEEKAHVNLLRSALGSSAVAKPNINLNALGIGFGSETEFLTVARLLQDIGVSGYSGAVSLFRTPELVKTAARLLAAESVSTCQLREVRFVNCHSRGVRPVMRLNAFEKWL